jgi:hypothetical protein
VLEHPVTKGIESSGNDGYVVEQQRIEHQPHDRPEREHAARDDAVECQSSRELPEQHRNDQTDDQAGQRGLPGGAAQDA